MLKDIMTTTGRWKLSPMTRSPLLKWLSEELGKGSLRNWNEFPNDGQRPAARRKRIVSNNVSCATT